MSVVETYLVLCNGCGGIFTPLGRPATPDIARNEAIRMGWITRTVSALRSDYCPTCAAALPARSEPPPGSVVLVHGETGTAWQRHASDGLWHSTAGEVWDWEPLAALKATVIYTAPRGRS